MYIYIYAYIYIFESDSLSSLLSRSGAPPAARVGHSLVALSTGAAAGDRALYLFGGRDENDNALNDLYMLRPVLK